MFWKISIVTIGLLMMGVGCDTQKQAQSDTASSTTELQAQVIELKGELDKMKEETKPASSVQAPEIKKQVVKQISKKETVKVVEPKEESLPVDAVPDAPIQEAPAVIDIPKTEEKAEATTVTSQQNIQLQIEKCKTNASIYSEQQKARIINEIDQKYLPIFKELKQKIDDKLSERSNAIASPLSSSFGPLSPSGQSSIRQQQVSGIDSQISYLYSVFNQQKQNYENEIAEASSQANNFYIQSYNQCLNNVK